MENNQNYNQKKGYQSPELKDFGKVGEVTNTGALGGTVDDGSGGGANYVS